ncbi:MAG: acetoin dehydrogenase [Deltaproteobacteria bacterium]|nr:MAG: acetoin dehydrogenase [Deltaproteobacteria bacterium]
MKNLKNKVAAITGAGSGIGRATAINLASKGCHLALCDLDEKGLGETKEMAEKSGVKVTSQLLDVSQHEKIYEFADNVVNDHSKVNIIINNAGVSLTAKVSEMEMDDFKWIMDINFWGVIYGTKAFLPKIEQAGEGHIVNISSLFGLLGMPTQSAYNASKFAVRGFTEALSMELKIYGIPIGVTSVHPGGIKTNIVKNSKVTTNEGIFANKEKAAKTVEKNFMTTPDQAAEKIVAGIIKNKKRVLIGRDALSLDLMQRIMPCGYQKFIGSGAKKAFVTRK